MRKNQELTFGKTPARRPRSNGHTVKELLIFKPEDLKYAILIYRRPGRSYHVSLVLLFPNVVSTVPIAETRAAELAIHRVRGLRTAGSKGSLGALCASRGDRSCGSNGGRLSEISAVYERLLSKKFCSYRCRRERGDSGQASSTLTLSNRVVCSLGPRFPIENKRVMAARSRLPLAVHWRQVRIGDRGRGQIGANLFRGIHHQIHILAHQPQREFRRIVTILDLPELPSHRGSNDCRLGQDVKQNIPINLKMLTERNCFCDCLHVKAEEQVDDQFHLNARRPGSNPEPLPGNGFENRDT